MAGPGDPKRKRNAMDGSRTVFESVLRDTAAWPAERPAIDGRAGRPEAKT